MARYLPLLVEAAGYLLVAAGAFLIDLRLGVVAVGIGLLYEAREARP